MTCWQTSQIASHKVAISLLKNQVDSAQVMISGSSDGAPRQALCSAGGASPSPSAWCSPCLCSLTKNQVEI